MNDPERTNIDNLTGLWKHFGATSHALRNGDGDGGSLFVSDAWPHRRWIDWGQPLTPAGAQDIGRLVRDDLSAVVPIWNGAESPLPDALGDIGFAPRFELLAMRRPSGTELVPLTSELTLQRVTTEVLADEWTRVASKSFGYRVDPPVIRGCLDVPGLDLFLATHQNTSVGTVLLYRDDAVLGVHMMGVVPEHRRRGHARSILHAALATARRSSDDDVALQASQAGEPLYRSMGFETQFPIPHYGPTKRDR